MTREERMKLIQSIEKKRDSRILTCFLGDRKRMETKLATDIFPFCLEHLSNMKHQKQIDLFLYSTGGITMAGFALVNLIREFCDSFNVIVPYKALSTATLVCLGADELIMTKMALLSPIDPSISTPLSPTVQIPGAPPGVKQNVPISVEDVISYLKLAKEEGGLKNEESLLEVFGYLSENVHPLALGSVYRAREQIRFLAKALLEKHMIDESNIQSIIKALTEDRFSHDYLIGRTEAKKILKLKINDVSKDLENDIIQLFKCYSDLFKLTDPYNPETELGGEETNIVALNRAVVESYDLSHVFRTETEIKRVLLEPPTVPSPTTVYHERKLTETWVIDNQI